MVLDASGSMTSRKMKVVRDATRVLFQALDDLKIPTEAFTFTTGDAISVANASQSTGEDYHELLARYSRWKQINLTPFPFSPPQSERHRIRAFDYRI